MTFTLSNRFLRDVYNAQRAAWHRYSVRQVTPVLFADEPVTLAEAQEHLKVFLTASSPTPISDEDAWITTWIATCRAWVEQYLGLALAARTMELVSNGFQTVAVSSPPGAAIELPFGPVRSITSIEYDDQAAADAAYTAAYDVEFAVSADVALATAAGDAAAALALNVVVDPADYVLDYFDVPARITLAYGATWPTTARSAAGSVRIRYVVGYTLPGDSPAFEPFPEVARSAILCLLEHFYKNKDAGEVPLGIYSLIERAPRERLGMA